MEPGAAGRFVARYRVHFAAAAFLAYLDAARLIAGAVSRAALAAGLCFASLLQAVYLFNMLHDSAEDVRNSAATRLSDRERVWVAASAAACLIAPLPFIFALPRLLPAYLGIATVGFLYSYPFGPKGFRLKSNALTKTAASVASYHVFLVEVPLILQGPRGWAEWGRVLTRSTDIAAVIAAFLWMNDIRDVDGDAAAGVRTLPVLVGIPATAAAAFSVCAASAAAVYLQGEGWMRALVPAFVGIMCLACLVVPAQKVMRTGLAAVVLLLAGLMFLRH